MNLTINGVSENLTPKRPWRYLLILALLIALALLAYFTGVFGLLGRNKDDEESLPAIRVEVSNGCGIEKLAADYSVYIKDKNIDVLRVSSTPYPIYNKSVLVLNNGDEQDLRRLQRMTGIQRFTIARNPESDVQFTIILGEDFKDYMKD